MSKLPTRLSRLQAIDKLIDRIEDRYSPQPTITCPNCGRSAPYTVHIDHEQNYAYKVCFKCETEFPYTENMCYDPEVMLICKLLREKLTT